MESKPKKWMAILKSNDHLRKAKLILKLWNVVNRIKYQFSKPKTHFQAEYKGEKILLIALFQKGKVRPDLIRLFEDAKAMGMYVFAINNLKIRKPESLKGLVDFYVERFNYGRDFGSYKHGFLYLIKKKWNRICPRVLLLNDSVYYTTKGLHQFLDDMVSTDKEVLGSTENYEIEYHLGSFSVSIGNSVLNKKRFIKFWKRYLLSDIRPIVIHRGEMGLSKVLKRSVSSPDAIEALYSTNRFMRDIQNSDELLDVSIRNARTCALVDWKRLSAKSVLDASLKSYITPKYDTRGAQAQVASTLEELNHNMFVGGYQGVTDLIRHNIFNDAAFEEKSIRDLVVSIQVEVFMTGSQVHQNAAILVHMGLPIVKLDGLYRGVFNISDMNKVSCQLPDQERVELQRLLLERPFGGVTLKKWKLEAFNRGWL